MKRPSVDSTTSSNDGPSQQDQSNMPENESPSDDEQERDHTYSPFTIFEVERTPQMSDPVESESRA